MGCCFGGAKVSLRSSQSKCGTLDPVAEQRLVQMGWWEVVVHTLSKWDLCQVPLLSLSHRHMEAMSCCILHSPQQLIPALSLKNKISTCLTQTFKHCKIRKHQNYSKYLYVTCCPVLTGLLITESYLSSFSLCWPFHTVSASASMGMSMFNTQYVALSPAYFVKQPNLALK